MSPVGANLDLDLIRPWIFPGRKYLTGWNSMKINQKTGLDPSGIPLNFESDLVHHLDTKIKENPNFPIYLLLLALPQRSCVLSEYSCISVMPKSSKGKHDCYHIKTNLWLKYQLCPLVATLAVAC